MPQPHITRRRPLTISGLEAAIRIARLNGWTGREKEYKAKLDALKASYAREEYANTLRLP